MLKQPASSARVAVGTDVLLHAVLEVAGVVG